MGQSIICLNGVRTASRVRGCSDEGSGVGVEIVRVVSLLHGSSARSNG
jgi:hypothetical protein